MSDFCILFGIEYLIIFGLFGGLFFIVFIVVVSELGGFGFFGLYGCDGDCICEIGVELCVVIDCLFVVNIWFFCGDEVVLNL